MSEDKPWTDECIARLRELWAAGASGEEIGRQMDRSKNSVVGKVHRLDLPSRPSPIRVQAVEAGRAKLTTPRRVTGPTLAPLAVLAVPEAAVVPAEPAAPVRLDPRRACCWPIGEPRTQGFRFCDGPSQVGKSYCPEHQALAYVRVVRARTPAELAADEARRQAAHARMARGGGTEGPIGTDWFAPRWAR
jgi:GcrA cell cycle regulator